MSKRPDDGVPIVQEALRFKIDNPDEGDIIGFSKLAIQF